MESGPKWGQRAALGSLGRVGAEARLGLLQSLKERKRWLTRMVALSCGEGKLRLSGWGQAPAATWLKPAGFLFPERGRCWR